MRTWQQRILGARLYVFTLAALTALSVWTARLSAATASVNLSTTHQTIRGFGGASVWMGLMTNAEMDLLFGSGPGTIGLRILRIRIAPDKNWRDVLENARKENARSAIVMCRP